MRMKPPIAIYGMTAILTVVQASAAAAQASAEKGQAVSPDLPAVRSDDIIVTAQRRSTRLQEVPFSISAFSAEDISRRAISGAGDLLSALPSASFTQGLDKGGSVISMRGLASSPLSPGADVPVGIFIDEISYPSPVDFHGEYYDVGRIEILKGPQGTLFGRNIIGGAISVTSNQPTDENKYGFRAGAGNFGQLSLEGYVNSANASGSMANRFSFSVRHNHGFIKDLLHPGKNLASNQSVSVRDQLLIKPSDDLNILLMGTYTAAEGRGSPIKLYGGHLIADDLGLPRAPDSDPFTVESGITQPAHNRYAAFSAKIDWTTSLGTLTSITAYRSTHFDQIKNALGGATVAAVADIEASNRQLTQELRLASPGGGAFDYVLGAFLLNEKTRNSYLIDVTPVPGSAMEAFGFGPGRTLFQQHLNIESYAAFGELTFRPIPTVSLSAGARHTYDKKSGVDNITGTPTIYYVAPFPATIPLGKSWTNFSPRGTIRFQPTRDLNIYATVGQAYQGGGYGFVAAFAALAAPFNPQKATNYEVGIKSQWFDRRLTLNAAVYREIINDFQVALFDPQTAASVIRNAGKARTQGVELEVVIKPIDQFSLRVNYDYTDAKFLRYLDGANNYAGNYLPYSSKHGLFVAGMYDLRLDDDHHVQLNASYHYRSRQQLVECNCLSPDITKLTSVNQIDASIDFLMHDDRWKLSVWGKNLTQDKQLQFANSAAGVFAQTLTEFVTNPTLYTAWNLPRTWGVSLSHQY